MSLANKTLFITGASRGIGLAIALRAARDGANIAVLGKTDTPNPKLAGTVHETVARCSRHRAPSSRRVIPLTRSGYRRFM